jgi:hypothetical protein
MTAALLLIARYQVWIYVLLGVGVLVFFYFLAQARQRLSRTPFGLEKEGALQRQNRALFMLICLIALAMSLFVTNRYITPNVNLSLATAAPGSLATAAPSPSPILPRGAAEPLVVDSSGCSNPNATLTDPKSGARIAGSYEVRGTANIDNFAFYKFEISSAATNGAWVSLYVGNTPVVNGTLGSFDASAYQPGDYAFRLVVKDSAGDFPPPCVVTVMLVNLVATPTRAP